MTEMHIHCISVILHGAMGVNTSKIRGYFLNGFNEKGNYLSTYLSFSLAFYEFN